MKVESVLISNPLHVYYLTGLKAALEPKTSIASVQNPMFLGISKGGAMFLVVARTTLANPLITDEVMFDSSRLFEGKLWTYGDYEINERVTAKVDFASEELSEVMAEMKSREGFGLDNVGAEELHVPYEAITRLTREFPSIKLSGISGNLSRLRWTKDETEVGAIKEGTRRLNQVTKEATSLMVAGETEIEALERLRGFCSEKFGPDASLDGQILSGTRTSEVFGRPSPKKLVAGDRIIVDFDTVVDGYHARKATTEIVGQESAQEDDSMNLVRKALEEGERKLRRGTPAKQIYDAVSGRLANGNHSQLVHEAGHGIGLEQKEEPFLIPSSDQEMATGMVIVMTAGSYSNTEGSRLSACYLVEESGIADLQV